MWKIRKVLSNVKNKKSFIKKVANKRRPDGQSHRHPFPQAPSFFNKYFLPITVADPPTPLQVDKVRDL